MNESVFQLEESISSILSYNVCGLSSKRDNFDFFYFVKHFDLFFLYETFVEEKDYVSFKNYFPGFKLHWISANRESSFGRAMGGSLFGIKLKNKSSNVYDFINLGGFT